MKLNLALATAALTLIGASAQAQLTLTAAVATDPGGAPIIDTLPGATFGFTEFTTTVSNPSSGPITLTSSSFTNAFGKNLPFFDVEGDPDFTDLIDANGNFLTLNANTALAGQPSNGGSATFGDAFEVDLRNGATIAGATYQFAGTSDPTGNATNRIVASFTFPAGTTAVPEPGSIALLASSVIGGGLFVARRRRK